MNILESIQETLGSILSAKGTSRFFESLLIQVLIAAVIAVMLVLSVHMQWFKALLLGTAIWTILLCFTGGINMWFIWVRSNTAVVLATALGKEVALVTERQLTNMQPSTKMRVVYGNAIDGKAPWEEVVNGVVINLLRSISLGGSLSVTTNDNVRCTLKWKAYLSVIQCDECIINLIRHSEDKIKGIFTAKCEAYLQSKVRTMTVDELFYQIYIEEGGKKMTKGHVELNMGFSTLLGGDDHIIPLEWEMGMMSRNLTVSELVLDEGYQRALQSDITAEKSIRGIERYTRAGVSPDVAANLNAADRGIEQPARVTSHYFDGLPPNAHVVVGEVERSGGGGGGRRNN